MTVSCLQKFAVMLKEKHVDNKDEGQFETQQKEMGFLIMELICHLISQNIANASKLNLYSFIWSSFTILNDDLLKEIFRELGGARVAHNMVPYKICRNQALNIVSTLLLSTAGEDDMSTLLGLMHTAKMEDLDLKNAVLKVILTLNVSIRYQNLILYLLF